VNAEFVHALTVEVAEARARMVDPIEFIVTAPNGYSIGLMQQADGTLTQTFESGACEGFVFPLSVCMFDATGRKHTIFLADECEACEVTQ
jgi:hypothetical protein